MEQKQQHPHPLVAIIPLAVLIVLIVLVINFFPDDALAGASQVALMTASAVCVAISMTVYKVKWGTFEEMIKGTVGDASVSILILLLIGMMSSTWMISGVVPTLIYYGVQFMSPMFFLPCACIISSLISVMTGTSWTTIATIGIALLGIGDALGIPAPYTAGAVISGAYFGDKLSPMSDTTVLASSVAGADLFSHIRYMMYTTVPSITLSLLLYLCIGLCYDGEAMEVSQYLTGLDNGFNISLWTLLVPAFTGYLIYKRTPSLITLLLSALSACVCALVLQPDVLVRIAGDTVMTAKSLFMGIMTTCYTKTHVDTGFEAINDLVATRGMAGMLDTIWLILCAMCFGSCMVASNMLKSITQVLLKAITNTVSLVCSTVVSGVLLNLVMGDQFLSIIMNASMFREEYRERGYRPELLSRSTEDSATVTSVLVPWTACGMTQSTVLGIPTLVYLPFCFFNIISPIMSCVVAMLGFIPKPERVGMQTVNIIKQ
nr:sodium:proton antiporter [uncultured Prevotella sp.]